MMNQAFIIPKVKENLRKIPLHCLCIFWNSLRKCRYAKHKRRCSNETTASSPEDGAARSQRQGVAEWKENTSGAMRRWTHQTATAPDLQGPRTYTTA